MSRPASAACDRCQMSVFSFSGSWLNPSAYICTIAASFTRSSRYFRSDAAGGAAGAAVSVAGAGPPQPAAMNNDMTAITLFMETTSKLETRHSQLKRVAKWTSTTVNAESAEFAEANFAYCAGSALFVVG